MSSCLVLYLIVFISTLALTRFPWLNLGLKDKDYVSDLVWSNLFNDIKCISHFNMSKVLRK